MVILPRKQLAELTGSSTSSDHGDESTAGSALEKAPPKLAAPAKIPSTASQGTLAVWLGLAAISGNLESVRELVEAGANIQSGTRSTIGHSPLAMALAAGQHEVAYFLASRGALLKDLPEGLTRQLDLLKAVEVGDLDKVERLLEKGSDPGYIRGEMTSQIDAAIQGNHVEILRRLLEAGADPNKTLEPPLQVATSYRMPAAVELLIQHGADLDRSDGDYGTPLEAAILEGQLEIVDLLLRAGADPTHGELLQLAAKGRHIEICVRLWPLVSERARAEAEEKMSPKTLSGLRHALAAE